MPMETYPGLGLPIPTIALSLLHQAAGGTPTESYLARVRQFHQEVRRQLAALRGQYGDWLAQQVEAATERATNKALEASRVSAARRSIWEAATRPAVQESLAEFAETVGLGQWLHVRGTAEIIYEPGVVGSDDVSKLTSDGRDYLASLGMQVGEQGRAVQETLLVFDGAVFFDLLEGIIQDWMVIYAGDHLAGPDQVRQRVFSSANVLYAAGEVVGGPPAKAGDGNHRSEEGGNPTSEEDGGPASEESGGSRASASLSAAPPTGQHQAFWDGAIFFDKGIGSYEQFRTELRAACEQAHIRLQVEPLSLWQRKLGASGGREFALRFRVPRDEMLLFHLVHVLRNSGQAGRESVVKRGRMILGQRIL